MFVLDLRFGGMSHQVSIKCIDRSVKAYLGIQWGENAMGAVDCSGVDTYDHTNAAYVWMEVLIVCF